MPTKKIADPLVGEILDIIDRSNSQRYKTAVALAEHFRGKYISRETATKAFEETRSHIAYESRDGGDTVSVSRAQDALDSLRRELGLEGEER